jgi:hypothetical protein
MGDNTALRSAYAPTSADDVAACEAATRELARELGRRAAREDFELQEPDRQARVLTAGRTGAKGRDVQNYAAAQRT